MPPNPSGAARPRRVNAKRHTFRKFTPWIIGMAVVAAVIAGLSPKPIPVEVADVHRAPLTVSVSEEGKTRIRHRYTISPPVSGFLKRPELRAGARIEAGKTVLAIIQAEPASLLNPRTQTEAEARVKAAEALLNQRETELERARSAADLAEKERKRTAALRKSGSASARETDQAETEATLRAREQRSAEFAINVAQFEVQQARAALLQAQGGESSGEPLKLIAPVNGFVLNVFEESARVIAVGTQIMEVGDTADLEAEIELLSTDAAGVQPGAEVIIERWGGPNPLRARVSLVEPAAFTKVSALGVEEQRVRVRVDFVDPVPPELLLGDRYRVEARIVTSHSPDVLQIPTGALFRRGGDWMCFVLGGGKARLQKVEIGHNNGVQAEVLTGIESGEKVIMHPPDVVTAGASVLPRKE
ncbi:efflux RND transporter periplasmic adaptor subunit [Verrucomicrobiota bacterium sgz303538]